MQLQRLWADDGAVSPVIGVILMVAITVILAAVIGTFVLGLGDQVRTTPPSASFSFDYESGGTSADCGNPTGASNEGVLTITHDGGPDITAERLTVKGSVDGPHDFTCKYGSNSEIGAGDSLSVSAANDDTVRVTWQAASGGETATLGKWSGPNA